MKLSVALIMASVASTVSATKTVSAKNAAKVLRAARRVEQQGDDANQNQYEYLSKYSLKLIGCKNGQMVTDAQTGEVEYSAALFRLCPTENGCASDAVIGCKEGYGDFVVGLSTFVDAYFEDQRDNMQWDDNFQVDRYAECAQYEMDNKNNNNNNNGEENQYADQAFYIGPTCTSDDLDVRLAVFSDETCTTESSVAFGDISNGWTLPFASGGMVSTYCSDCVELNDNGAYELREMCMNLYTEAEYACETKMEYFSSYGQNTLGCDTISEITPAAVKKAEKKGGSIFGWIVFFFLIGGFGAYIVWWRKKKMATSDGLVA